MHDLRFDIAPLPIAELAPIRLEATDRAEPFVLGGAAATVTGDCRLALTALRRAGRGGAFMAAAEQDVHAIITPCGVVRTVRLDDVLITERVAWIGGRAAIVTQWSVAADAELLLDGLGTRPLAAGETATVAGDFPLQLDIAQAFRDTAGSLARAVRAGLQVETSGQTGAALAWAKARLWLHACGRSTPTLPTSLAMLVAGQPEQARHRLDAAVPDLLPLLAARYAAWTGDIQRLGALRAQLRAATDALARTPPLDDAAAAVRLAGVTELERTAADLGDPSYAAELHSLARRTRSELTGRPLHTNVAALLAALRVAEPRTPPAHWTGAENVAQHAWLTWAALEQGLLSDGCAGWQRLVAEADTPVRGAWPHRFGTIGDDPEATALFVLTFAHGVLGLEADAPRHRIRIAPRLATGQEGLGARGIPCGDASVSLSVDVVEREITLRLTQDAGAIPLTALLEPVVDGRVVAAWVDGRRAELDDRPYGEGTVVPVQLMLDAERTLRIEYAERG